MKRTYQPHVKRKMRKHGYMERKKTKAGRRILKNRTAKGRHSLTVKRWKK